MRCAPWTASSATPTTASPWSRACRQRPRRLQPSTTGRCRTSSTPAAKAFLNAVGASSGPLYATALLRAGKSAGPVKAMPRDGLRSVISAMAEGIEQRGKGAAGQKTMLDAWLPAAEAARSGAAPGDIAAAAQRGAEATKDMVATMGRAARLGERSLGHPDPGAVSAAMIVALICDRLEG